jgi:hypothetical protein
MPGGDSNAAMNGQTQKLQQAVIDSFRRGDINVLVATCIGEEGLDIGAVDLVVFYDSVGSPIRYTWVPRVVVGLCAPLRTYGTGWGKGSLCRQCLSPFSCCLKLCEDLAQPLEPSHFGIVAWCSGADMCNSRASCLSLQVDAASWTHWSQAVRLLCRVVYSWGRGGEVSSCDGGPQDHFHLPEARLEVVPDVQVRSARICGWSLPYP